MVHRTTSAVNPLSKERWCLRGCELAHLKQTVNSKNTHKESAEAKSVRSCKHKREPFLDHTWLQVQGHLCPLQTHPVDGFFLWAAAHK